MAVDQTDVIDMIGVDKKTNDIIMTISDHISWENAEYHLGLLEDKINLYLTYIECDDFKNQFSYSGKEKIIINIVGKFSFPNEAKAYLGQINKLLKKINVRVESNFYGVPVDN